MRGVDDILEALGELFPRTTPAGKRTVEPPDPETPAYSPEEALVMLHVDGDGVSVDELVRRTQLPAERVNAIAMGLRIKGFVKFLPGNRVAPLGPGRR